MSEQMDDLSKALAAGQSRRSVLRAILSSVFGLGAVALTPRRALADQPRVVMCIQQCCHGLSGFERIACTLTCLLGIETNSCPLG